MLCNNCGSLEHWEKNCPKPKRVASPKGLKSEGRKVAENQVCPNCLSLHAEVDRLRAKYEMTAEEKLDRIQEQRRAASKRYREKNK